MNVPRMHIEIGDVITPDVYAGLMLYSNLVYGECNKVIAQDWLYWFKQNPFGKGLYAIAKQGGEVVGFYALIPVEMFIDGRLIRGAKGEFFGVAPAFRTAISDVSALRLPYALSRELHEAAQQYGMDHVFLVSPPSASICHAIAGAKTIKCDVDQYTMFFRNALPALDRRAFGHSCGQVAQYCRGLLTTGNSAVRRTFAKSLLFGVKRGSFTEVSSFSEMPVPRDKNMLMSNSKKMFDFRFPAAQYLTYSVKDVDGDCAFMVFNIPRRGGRVRLKHWTDRKFPFMNAVAVLEDVVWRCRKAHALSLAITVPVSAADIFGPIRQFGFTHRRGSMALQIYSGVEGLSTDSDHWWFTESHKGFMGFE